MILGHDRQVSYLKKVFEKGKFAHAYLFSGPEHVGKLTVVKEAAKFFHCEKERAGNTCGQCPECAKIEAGNHPSVMLLDRCHSFVSKKEIRKDIPIEDIRELKRILSTAAREGEQRVVIVNDAERMSEEAANSLLKILEEPGQGVIFFLVSSSKDSLPVTVVSRTQVILFSLVPDGVMSFYLASRGVSQPEAEKILKLSFGRPGIMLKLVEDEKYFREEVRFLAALNVALQAGPPEAFIFTERIWQDDSLKLKAAEYIMRYLRHLLLAAASEEERKVYLEKTKKAWQIYHYLLTTNVNPRLALDLMFIEAGLTFTKP